MKNNLFHSLARNRLLAGILVVVLLASTGGLLAWKLRQTRGAGPGHTIPLAQNGSTGGNVKQATTGNPQGSGMINEGEQLFSIKLSQGKAQAQAVEVIPLSDGEPLTEAEIASLLARLPDLPTQPDDSLDFQLAGELLPPPRPGDTVPQPFPPPDDGQPADSTASGPLHVLRYSPEGEIPVAPFLSVTFDQPMVALDTLTSLSAVRIPAQIEPALPGTWRWLGARTLTFQYQSDLIDRLPKATQYTVTIPAGTQSVTGGVLAESVQWQFSTPPPVLTQSYPLNAPQPLDPLFLIAFDQRIDPSAVLANVQVMAGGLTPGLHLVSEEEVRAEKAAAGMLDGILAGRWLAFRADEMLPADSDVTVTIAAGTPSAEGPLRTSVAQSYQFRTYAALHIDDYGCAWGGERCQPSTPFYIRFNNPIDEQAYQQELLRIDPGLAGAAVTVMGNTIQIEGATRAQTSYTVTLSGKIKDIFGQSLGSDARLTFRVGPAEPTLFGSGRTLVTLDPAAPKPIYSVYAMNYTTLDLQVYAVQPSDWPAYLNYLRDYQRSDESITPPGRKLIDRALPVNGDPNTLNEVNIDLSELMDGLSSGQFIVIVKPPSALFKTDASRYWSTVQTWVQVTQIGLDAFNDASDLVVWASALRDGAPLADVRISAQPTGQQITTSADGTVRLPIPDGATYLVAQLGSDQAILPRSDYFWGDDRWETRPVNDALRWYVFDDRGMYRPGESVHVKGWLRLVGGKQTGDVGLVGSELSGVTYQVTDAQGNAIGSGQAETNLLGGFDFSFTLPEQVNLGQATLILDTQGSLQGLDYPTSYHPFTIQEFRRPEFEVKARSESAGPYYAGDSATLAVQAAYYAGGALPNASVTWQVSSSPSSYSPPNWPDFSFGHWTPWWWFSDIARGGGYWPGDRGPTTVETFTGQTDANGEHFLQLAFQQQGEPQPVSVLAEATVMDVNRQAWTGSTSLLVHPASLYIGLRSERYFVGQGQPMDIQFIVTDLDGRAQPGQAVEIRAARLEWKYSAGQWQEQEADVQVCQMQSETEAGTCRFDTPSGGTYRITANVRDGQGRLNQCQITRWVSGGKQPPARKVEQEELTLVPDKESYQPGDVAEILVLSPFSPAEGLLTVNRSGIVSTERFTLNEGSAVVRVPITESAIPNLFVQVDVNGAAARLNDDGTPLTGAAPRPAFATGQIKLPVPPLQRSLSVQITPAQPELEPGGETNLTVTVLDANGRPMEGAELAVLVVDEAILALSNYQLADPLTVFYAERPLDLNSVYGRASIILANPAALNQQQNSGAVMATQTASDSDGRGGGPVAGAAPTQNLVQEKGRMEADAPPNQADPIRVRADFNPLAVFAPAVPTGEDGSAQVAVKLPDNLTRYRIMVVAVEQGQRFGMGEANLTARLPLMVRPAAPRFLNFGDRFELPVVLQNQTDEAMVVEVVAQASNLSLTGDSGLRVTVPARDRIEVRFAAAAEMAGTARVQIAAVGNGRYADAATIELPVYTPATTEAFATYGVIDQGAVAQPVASPQGVYAQFGGLEVTTSSTALQALTDAVLYLVTYPYDCSEQIASRVLAIAALRDVLSAFEAEGLPSPQALQASVQSDIESLQRLQNDDGSFPYWRRGQESSPYNTVHVTHALLQAQAKGFSVPSGLLERSMNALRQIEQLYPEWYYPQTRWTVSAYALYVRAQGGDRDPAKALALINEAGLDNLSLDAIGWLWPVLQGDPAGQARLDEIRLLVANRVVETPSAANFTNRYDEQNYLLLGSDRRTDAILLNALIEDNPQSDLIPKLVNGLLAQRTRGRWGNTQENVFILLSLDRYFNTYESETPDFVARLWLGDAYAGSHNFTGYSTERSQTNIPMAYLVEEMGGTQNLILSKDGPGRLYYRLGLRYAPTDLRLPALDMGFVVQRVYEAVDDPNDVRQDEDGVWHIKAGARVRVHLSMVADNRRYHVALSDPLPAGFEIINPDLAVMGGLPPTVNETAEPRFYAWWWGPWYQHENLRDERAEVFTTLLWEGVYQYSYIVRATTPGQFVAPPTKAEEMYTPEVFGRSGSDIVIIE